MNLTTKMVPTFDKNPTRKNTSRFSDSIRPGLYLLLSLIILTGCTTVQTGSSDVKNERETSITPGEFPANADLALARYWPVVEQEKYFRQLGPDKVEFEKKFVSEGNEWSIAFTSNGDFIDAELLIPFDQISTPIQGSIIEYLDEAFNEYEITRTQIQYLPEEDEERDELDDILEDIQERDYEDLIINYEIEIEGENANSLGKFELLFDAKGDLIQSRKIVDRPSDNIWYR